MSTAERPTTTIPPLVAGHRLAQPEFHRRYESMPPATRAELVGGVVFMPSPVSRDHCESTPNVTFWLVSYRRRTPGVRVSDNATLILGPSTEVQPDCLMRIEPERGGRCRLNEDGYLAGPPELVVEVARSGRRFDLGAKLADYERAGAPEYVVVAIDPDEVFRHVRQGERLVRVPPDDDGLYRSRSFPGLWLDPAALLAGNLDGILAALDRGLATPEHAAFADA